MNMMQGAKSIYGAVRVHCVSAHNQFMQNNAGKQISRHHTNHRHESRGFVL